MTPTTYTTYDDWKANEPDWGQHPEDDDQPYEYPEHTWPDDAVAG